MPRSRAAEAGISRATYYRSPLAKITTGLLRTPDAPRPQTDTLTAEIARLKKADRTLRSPHAAEQREARATIAAYANQIQTLSLLNAELEAENATLREALRQGGRGLSPCDALNAAAGGTSHLLSGGEPLRRLPHGGLHRLVQVDQGYFRAENTSAG